MTVVCPKLHSNGWETLSDVSSILNLALTRFACQTKGELPSSTDFDLAEKHNNPQDKPVVLPESRSLVLRIVQVFWLHTERESKLHVLCQFKIATPCWDASEGGHLCLIPFFGAVRCSCKRWQAEEMGRGEKAYGTRTKCPDVKK